MAAHIPRLMKSRVREELLRHAAVELIGPADCGKTSLGLALASSADLLDMQCVFPERETVRQGEEFVRDVRVDPTVLVQGVEPHLVADLHCVPAARRTVVSYTRALGESGATGALVLTANWDADKALAWSNAGAPMPGSTVSLRMLPLSLQELGLSSGRVSLAGLFGGEVRESKLAVESEWAIGSRSDTSSVRLAGATSSDLARVICRGGWPGVIELDDETARDESASIGQQLVHEGALRSRLTVEGAGGCVWALARCLGEIPTYEQVAVGIEATVGRRPARDTVRRYLRELEREQVTLVVPGWTPPGRERIRARTKPKQYFVDPSLPASLLGVRAEALAEHPSQLQVLLANLVARDLQVYLEATGGGRICHYRDDRGTSVDFVLERRDADGQRWGGVQVRLSEATVDDAAHDLLALARTCGEATPAFLVVVTGQGSEAYQRADGVLVVPVTCLGA